MPNANSTMGTYTVTASAGSLTAYFTLTNTGLHSYVVTVSSDTSTGIPANCPDQSPGAASPGTNCSLRDALAAAATNATSTEPASITFAQTTRTLIILAKGTLNVPAYTTIQGATSGAGSGLTNLITVDGNNATSIFTQAANTVQSTINNLIFTHGNAASRGGAILMYGSLSVNNSTFTDNQAPGSGGAIENTIGDLTVFGSTFANNSTNGFGGAIDNSSNSTVTITESTFTQNKSTGAGIIPVYGGAIYSEGTASISASTITGNTALLGGGVYNLGTMSLSSNIITGNTNTSSTYSNPDCGGFACTLLWDYVRIIQLTPTVTDSGSITIAFKDSLGNSFSQTASYGKFSSPANIASAFGSYFYYNTSGLDTTSITAQPDSPPDNDLLIITSKTGTLNSFTFNHTGQSFSAEQVLIPSLLSVNNNVSGVTAAQINLSPLGNNGGPTQTMVPLTGSLALCAIKSSNATGTDQRGEPRIAVVGTSTCQDAGAVQTAQ